jgi:hypothetical protein
VEEESVRWSLSILSEKNVAKLSASDMIEYGVGRLTLAVRCRIVLTVDQRRRGWSEFESMRVEK